MNIGVGRPLILTTMNLIKMSLIELSSMASELGYYGHFNFYCLLQGLFRHIENEKDLTQLRNYLNKYCEVDICVLTSG